MESSFLLLLFYVQFTGVSLKLSYNTYPEISSSIGTPYSPKVITKACFLNPDKGPCRANIKMWYFNITENNCTQFKWGGCQGNGNRYLTSNECFTSCVSRRNYKAPAPRYCQLTYDYGFCFGDIKRWYFDRFYKTCKQAIYSGCGGNKNNFYSFEQCDSICRLGHPYHAAPTTTPVPKVKKIIIINADKHRKDTVESPTKNPNKIEK